MGSYRNMRILVMFDLPTDSRENRRIYSRFRKDLLGAGFDMLQYSVYTRFCPNWDIADKNVRRVESFSPRDGNVRIIKITDNQFIHMRIPIGARTAREKHDENLQLAFF